jgi:zinc protease
MTLLLATFALFGSAFAGEPGGGVEWSAWKLDNGLQVVHSPAPILGKVCVDATFQVGARHEGPGEQGFSRLMAPLMLNRELEGMRWLEVVSTRGATFELAQDIDRTRIRIVVDRADLPNLLGAISQWFRGGLGDITPELVAAAVPQALSVDPLWVSPADPQWAVAAFDAVLFPDGHPLHRFDDAEHQDLQAATPEAARAFFGRWFSPERLTLSMSGEVSEAEARALVDAAFAGIPRGAAPEPARPRFAPPAATLVVEVPSPGAGAYLGWIGPGRNEEGYAELELVARLLSGGPGSRLHQTLVSSNIASVAVPALIPYQDHSLFLVTVGAGPGREPADVAGAVEDVVQSMFKDARPTAREIGSAREALARDHHLALADGLSRAIRLGELAEGGGDPAVGLARIEAWLKATPDDVLDAAWTTLSAPHVTILVAPSPP